MQTANRIQQKHTRVFSQFFDPDHPFAQFAPLQQDSALRARQQPAPHGRRIPHAADLDRDIRNRRFGHLARFVKQQHV